MNDLKMVQHQVHIFLCKCGKSKPQEFDPMIQNVSDSADWLPSMFRIRCKNRSCAAVSLKMLLFYVP
jgi:hypothetical protein